ncbi:uncharacterized protein LOC142226290 [Haematobia irritans]|uniref:uncharacterized protein LOC142226290 n=1 Tax=Haematobia irritans TaxID=7368 RepID=UPI003F502D51
MITDRNKLNFVTIQWLWLLCLILVGCGGTAALAHNAETAAQHKQPQQQQQLHHQQLHVVESNVPVQQDVTVRNFSPRMDYNSNEWRPVGRGDPLKNDPTFDYSPPTLDRVRYWADPDKDKEKFDEATANILDAKLKKANPGKNEILLLGVTGDRIRGGMGSTSSVQHPQGPHMMKNAKGETPLLQPKYTSIRRSYYSHQLPTHLMPPPMQPAMPMMQATQQQPQSAQSQSQNGGHMMKPSHADYRHNMPIMSPHHSHMSSSPLAPGMNAGHSKPYHHITATSSQPWMHSPNPVSSSMVTAMPSSLHHMKPSGMNQPNQHFVHSPSHGHQPSSDTHHHESMKYLTYTRPSMTTTSHHSMTGGSHDYYSPNSIRGSMGVQKTSSSSRKPWIHDLLQKEFIKSAKPTAAPNSLYHSEAVPVRSQPQTETHFEAMIQPAKTYTIHQSINYSPVTFVTTSTPSSTTVIPTTSSTTSTTQTPIFVTASSSSTTSTTYHTTPSPIFFTHTTTTPAPKTTTTLSPTRLLIPNTSNLAYRPTVAPIKMTTDSLFSHYNQPEKPLRGPMYLIIEGHSKVKTYGKDELDPHKPKIVPVISSREPVVRRADPNEKRGTPETFEVKHLHTKTTQPMEKVTESTPKMTVKTTTTTTTKKPVTSTTAKAPSSSSKPLTTKKPQTAMAKKVESSTVSSPKKVESTTTKPIPKLSVTTTTLKPTKAMVTTKATTTTTTTIKPKIDKIPAKTPVKGEKLGSNNVNTLNTQEKPSQGHQTEPPTAMQGFLNLLGSSLDSFLKEDIDKQNNTIPAIPSNGTTKLKSITMQTQPQIEARVSTKLQAIKAIDYDDDDSKFFTTTTEYLPRETRQIFDYDQLPESRVTPSDKDYKNYEEEDDLSTFGFDDEYDEDEEGDNHQFLKRIDALVNSSEDLDDLDTDTLTDLSEDNLEILDLARRQQRKTTKA